MRKNRLVSWAFSQIADLLEIQGGDEFKVRAYRRAARSVEQLSEDISVLAAEGRLLEIPGIGKALAGKVNEILATGTCRYLEDLKRQVPVGLIELTRIPGVGARTAMALHRALAIESVEELEAAARAGKLRQVAGLGEKKEQSILQGIESLKKHAGLALLGSVRPLALEILHRAKESPAARDVALVGELRRWTEVVSQASFLVCVSDPEGVTSFTRWLTEEGGLAEFGVKAVDHGVPEGFSPWSSGARDISLLFEDGLKGRGYVVAQKHWPSSLLWFTGSQAHVEALRGIAAGRGFELTPAGLIRRESGELVEVSEEGDLYAALGMAAVPPELREDTGEVEAALRGELPDLIQLSDIAGDLHVHTSWTDGTEEIETMARACMALGYSYMAVCDHSKSLRVAGGLDEDAVLEQARRIRDLNRRLESEGADFRILAGIEVDILPDGTLDLPDHVLEQLDLVVASVHSAFKQSRSDMTARMERAMNHPAVDIIGHPTGRLIGRRSPYEVDISRLLEVAARTGTAMEINATFDRLDLDEHNARKAAEMGVPLVINTDAHSKAGLGDMIYGVGVARRAWIRPSSVLNCAPLDRFLSSLKRNRSVPGK